MACLFETSGGAVRGEREGRERGIGRDWKGLEGEGEEERRGLRGAEGRSPGVEGREG